jgi:hypothetical protein
MCLLLPSLVDQLSSYHIVSVILQYLCSNYYNYRSIAVAHNDTLLAWLQILLIWNLVMLYVKQFSIRIVLKIVHYRIKLTQDNILAFLTSLIFHWSIIRIWLLLSCLNFCLLTNINSLWLAKIMNINTVNL